MKNFTLFYLIFISSSGNFAGANLNAASAQEINNSSRISMETLKLETYSNEIFARTAHCECSITKSCRDDSLRCRIANTRDCGVCVEEDLDDWDD